MGALLAIVRLEASWLLVGVVFAAFAVGAWKVMESRGTVRESFGSSYAETLGNWLGFTQTEGYTGLNDNLTREFNTTAPILDPRDVIDQYVPDVIGLPQDQRTGPTPANPFMNVLLTEISDNPYRNPAANVQGESVKAELDQYFNTMFARDPGDVFNHTQNQRNWVAMPSTTIPNDQSAFANWLYRVPGQTYKEGNLAASQHVNTGADVLPWRSLATLT